MKRLSAKTFSGGPIALCSIFLFLLAAGPVAIAAPLQEARVSQVIQDVRLLEPQATPRPAAVNDKVTLGRAVRTGVESRAELTFTDLTITRLGANTIFSLTAGAREINLRNGTILVQVPAKAASVKINTASVTVGITGGTALLSTGPPLKFMVLEGVGTIYPKGHPEKAATVHGGEMVLMTVDGRFTLPQQFDVSLVLATSHLIIDFPPLANLPLILVVMNQQLAEQQLAGTTTQSLAKNLIDVIDVIDQSATANPIVLAAKGVTPSPPPPPPTPTPPPPTPTPPPPTPTPPPPTPTPPPPTPTPPPPTPTPPPPTPTPPPPTPTPPPPTPTPPPPTPTPTPSKFGPPSVITSPVPYVITSGTVITTDPSITTNGVTDFGKIWRSSAIDGAFSLWAFGSTSPFDTAFVDDNFFADPTHFPIAVFKFQSLSLNGNPTIDLSNGGVTKLALIGVDGITSAPPGGTLTFTGLDLLALATVNGSINLTSDISFQNLSELAMYARGVGSNLTLDSPISNIGTLDLAAEGSIQLTNAGTMSVGEFDAITGGGDLVLQIGGSLLLNGSVRLDTLVLPGTTVASGANLTVNITGDYTNSSTTDFSRLRVTNDGAHIGTGGNIAVNIGGNLTTTGPVDDFVLLVQNTSGQIDNGGNITLMVDGSVSTQGQLSLLVENFDFSANPAGHIGTGGNISLTTGGNLTADSISAVINNQNGGTIGSGASLVLNISGALTTLQNGTDYFGDTSSLTLVVTNRYVNTLGSTIGLDDTLDFHADSASIGGNLNARVSDSGGTVSGNALLNFNVTHDMTVQGDAVMEILNSSGPASGAASPIGGTIHGSAILQISANNLTVNSVPPNNPFFPNSLTLHIANQNGGVIGSGGVIDFNATVTLDLSGNLTTAGDAFLAIQNQNNGGTSGGTIGGDATIHLNAVNVSVGGALDAEIDNFSGGTIGGNATVSVSASSDINIVGDATFQILNNDAGHIGGSANILVTTGGDLTANSIFAFINNHNAGSIGSGANLTFNIGGALVTQGDAIFVISNLNEGPGGGTIGSLASVDINAASISVGGFFQSFSGANGGGSITGSASNLVNATGNLVVQGPIAAQIEDTGFIQINPIIFIAGGHIGGDATVTLSAQNITTSSTATGVPGTDVMALEASIYTNGQGTIGGNAIVNVLASQNISAPGTVFFTVANGNYQNFGPGTIGGDAQINVTGANLSTGALFDDIYNYGGGSIGRDAIISLNVANGFTATGNAELAIVSFGGIVTRNASISVSAGDISTPSLTAEINNSSAGLIGGDATINLSLGGLSVSSGADVTINNSNGGTIGGNATINMNVSGTTVAIDNSNGGTIGGNAAINVSTANISVGSLVNQINNTGGSMGASTEGGATINMNVSGTATVTNDATLAIYGSDGATFAAINVNGGSYNVGGTFLSYIDGNGTITFNNATAHANILKAGVFGANGVLNIGGGTLSADTTLKLYANSSNGTVNFVANVTLTGAGAKIIAGDTVKVFDSVVVTIGVSPADIYTNHAHYSSSNGGDGTTTGIFASSGFVGPAVTTHLGVAPPAFDDPPPPAKLTTTSSTTTTTTSSKTLSAGSGTTRTTVKSPTLSGTTSTTVKSLTSPSTTVTSSGKIVDSNLKTTSKAAAGSTINVSSTAELLSLLDGAAVAPNGKITISGSRSTSNLKNLSGTNINGLSRADRRMLIHEMRDRDATRIAGRKIL